MTERTTTRSPLWTPGPHAWETTRLGSFAKAYQPLAVGDYETLWRWSVEDSPEFWNAVWESFEIHSSTPRRAVLGSSNMPGASWFEGASLNYAEHMLRGNGLADDDVAVVGVSQTRTSTSLTMGELRTEVRRVRAGLVRLGVGVGDRVAAYMPNIDEALIAFLATASLGAIWSSCAPEFGSRAIIDRWSQIEPKVLLVIDGYRYGDKDISAADTVSAFRSELPSVQTVVALRYLSGAEAIVDSTDWNELAAASDEPLTFAQLPFDHPLYILYSSGTTGLPKAIVHGHGGILLEHAKQLGLQMDLGPGDRFFWFSTTGWMMWNYLISGLLVGASIVLFDGDPGYPDLQTLWSMAASTGATFVGVAAPFVMVCRDASIHPSQEHDLSRVRGLGSTGAPLPVAGFEWLAHEVGDVPIASISGGTDVCSAFLGGAPVVPVTAGFISCRQLGWSIEAFDVQGASVRNIEGELVITRPAPSMPIGFWGDDGSRYESAYFNRYAGVWRHGDWITIYDDGRSVISGRSDATLNRGGVRLGTADFYTVVEADPLVEDSIVVHLEGGGGGLGDLILFVKPNDGCEIDDAAKSRLRTALRRELSPRHVPDDIVVVSAVPRTLSGKKLEVPVKRILLGDAADDAASTGALRDPGALELYVRYAKASLGVNRTV